MTPSTPWEAGRFDQKAGPKRLLFGRMYEDPAIERGAFRPGGRIFCIASAGSTARALAPITRSSPSTSTPSSSPTRSAGSTGRPWRSAPPSG